MTSNYALWALCEEPAYEGDEPDDLIVQLEADRDRVLKAAAKEWCSVDGFSPPDEFEFFVRRIALDNPWLFPCYRDFSALKEDVSEAIVRELNAMWEAGRGEKY